MELTLLEIKARIIRKLVLWRKWGGAHTENILKGLPSHLRGDKRTKQALEELEKAEWLLSAKKTGEIHYSLNPRKTDEILQFYERYCNQE
ncbi:TPA: hypothetical protein HA249_00955 [Candidatus Woesearchaeota archaeon]|nr:hypothetical protein [Candidatus Woesearchaeota archaeon]HIH46832.1 hypothetical protein [Candidatus Woesearchaeota archaeon]